MDFSPSPVLSVHPEDVHELSVPSFPGAGREVAGLVQDIPRVCWGVVLNKEPNFSLGWRLGSHFPLESLAQREFLRTAASLQQEEIFSRAICPLALRSRGALKGEPGRRSGERVMCHAVHVPLMSGACWQPRPAAFCWRRERAMGKQPPPTSPGHGKRSQRGTCWCRADGAAGSAGERRMLRGWDVRSH